MELAAHTFREIAKLIHEDTGIALGADKAYLVRHRLEPLVRSEGLEDFEALVQRLRMRAANRLRSAFIDAITVKETRFFRDQAFFECLARDVLPACAAKLDRPGNTSQRVRIWSAASSTGQEACSLAILVRELSEEHVAKHARESRFSIVASDISQEAIEFSKAGLYSKSDVDRGLSESRLRTHFRHSGARWRFDESLSRMTHFRTFNLLHSPAELGPFDLILCRNVMIYFDDATRRRVCRGLYSALHPGGFLALGSAESLYGMEDRFETVALGKTILYRRPQRVG